MANHVLKNPPEFNTEMRKMETTDPGHANVFNPLLEQLLNNDAFLKAIADAAKEHMQNGEIHVTEQDKEGWNAKAGTTEATQSAAGLMSAGDKQKLDNVAANAEVNQNALSNIQVGSVTITANGKTATFTMEAGDNITLTADNATKKVTIKSNRDNGNADTLDGYHAEHFAAADHRHIQVDNWRQGTDLPSTYPKGESIFFSNNPANKFNGLSYCTVHTIKGYVDNVPACIQFIYPYNDHADKYYFREALYNSDVWRSWQEVITSANIGSQTVASATKAIQDGNGNNIASTYAKRVSVTKNIGTKGWYTFLTANRNFFSCIINVSVRAGTDYQGSTICAASIAMANDFSDGSTTDHGQIKILAGYWQRTGNKLRIRSDKKNTYYFDFYYGQPFTEGVYIDVYDMSSVSFNAVNLTQATGTTNVVSEIELNNS